MSVLLTIRIERGKHSSRRPHNIH